MAPDEHNCIPLACRALLASPLAGKTVLFETGIGAFFEPKLRERYGVQEDRHVLLESLRAAGFEHGDIDVVVLSHLHFDHAGGLLAPWVEGRAPELLFRSEEHTSELQSLMRISYAVFCLKKKISTPVCACYTGATGTTHDSP